MVRQSGRDLGETSRVNPVRRAAVTFVGVLVAVLLLAVAADMIGFDLPGGIGYLVGIPVGLVGAVLAYRGAIR
jgi:hypothetical protein